MFLRPFAAIAAALLIPAPVAPAQAPTTCSAPVAVPPSVTTPNSTYYSDSLPPARFRGDNSIKVRFSDQAGVDAVCGKAPCNMVTLACTSVRRPQLMTLPNPCRYPTSDGYAQLVCHELGHLNGWPATHGD
jgi:hypothetical protein